MAKKTVKQLTEEIEKLREDAGNVHISSHLVWNVDQIAKVIEETDVQNGIIKIEITHGFEPGKKCYNVHIWHYPKLRN